MEPTAIDELIARDGRPGLLEVLNTLAEAVVLVAPDGEIEFANTAACETLVDPGGALEGQSFASALGHWGLSTEQGAELSLKHLLDPDAAGPVRAIHRASGELRWWLPQCRALRDQGQNEVLRLLVIEDITALKQAEVRMRVLADSGRTLADSLDYEQRLVTVAHVAVPGLADWCAVYLTDERLNLRRVVTAHRDPQKQALADRIQELEGSSIDPDSDLARVVRSGESILHEHIPRERIARRALNEEHLRLLSELELRSAVVVPMRVPNRTIGAMLLATAESGRQLTVEDQELAEQLGRRAAVAIDNARLHRQISDMAETLARSFLPPELPAVPGWEVASMYRPVLSELRIEIGGDFLDMMAVGQRWFAILGDIEGKGVLAATVSGLMRHGARLAAQHNPEPSAVLAQLDQALQSHPSHVTSTMLCARLGDAELTVASAGHPAPFIISPDGDTAEVSVRGPMLGAFGDAVWHDCVVPLERDQLIMLYTDGITETLGGRSGLGRDRLRTLLCAQGGRTPAEVVQALDRALAESVNRDDLAALVLRRS